MASPRVAGSADAPPPRPARFASVDALRGLAVAAMLLVNYPGDWGHVFPPLLHAEWHGFTPTDLIFPLFLFIVGVSIALSVVPARDAGADAALLARSVLARALRIVALGLALHILAWWWLSLPALRIPGVLQRIGVCYGVAGLLAIGLRMRGIAGAFVVVLLGYAGLLAAGGTLEPWVNLASRLDTAVFGAHAYRFDAATGLGHDPEGLASTLGAIATTLLGVLAGAGLRAGRVRGLVLAGGAALLLGAAVSPWLPWNKNLWTSSYVLWSSGWALLLLAAAHAAIDRRGLPAVGRAFGVNAITAYAGSSALYLALVACGAWDVVYTRGFASWITPLLGPDAASLAFALAYVALWWLAMRAMLAHGWIVTI